MLVWKDVQDTHFPRTPFRDSKQSVLTQGPSSVDLEFLLFVINPNDVH